MKKILSLFLASLMVFSLFTVVTAFAASEATGDGGTMYYKFDFESGISDTINGATPVVAGYALPEKITDSSASNIGKFSYTSVSKAVMVATPLIDESTDRYTVLEFDLKKEATSSSCYIQFRYGSTNQGMHAIGTDAIPTWQHMVFVLDTTANASSKYDLKVFVQNGGVYTDVTQNAYKAMASNAFQNFRIQFGTLNDTIYIDNLELKTYKNFYETINSAASAQTVLNAIDRFAGIGFVTLPTAYSQLSSPQKLSVAAKLLNKSFASDADVNAAMELAINSEVVVTKYLNWDFEDNSTNDTVTGEPFMEDGDAENTIMHVVPDPQNLDNNVAKASWGNNIGNVLTYTNAIDNETSNFKYLTYEFKAYGAHANDNSEATTFPMCFAIRSQNGESATECRNATKNYPLNTWHQFKYVVNTVDKEMKFYVFANGAWKLEQTVALPTNYGFYRLQFKASGYTDDIYYDDFKVTGYNDVITEITEATSEGVANVLEVYDEIGIVELPAAYADLDADEKAALGAYIKSKTYTSVQILNDDIAVYLSNDELVVISAKNDENNKLDTLRLAVNKNGVSLASANLIIAAYDSTELVGVSVCDVDTDVFNGTVIEKSGLAFDISSADSVKLMLVDNMTSMTPAVKATALK